MVVQRWSRFTREHEIGRTSGNASLEHTQRAPKFIAHSIRHALRLGVIYFTNRNSTYYYTTMSAYLLEKRERENFTSLAQLLGTDITMGLRCILRAFWPASSATTKGGALSAAGDVAAVEIMDVQQCASVVSRGLVSVPPDVAVAFYFFSDAARALEARKKSGAARVSDAPDGEYLLPVRWSFEGRQAELSLTFPELLGSLATHLLTLEAAHKATAGAERYDSSFWRRLAGHLKAEGGHSERDSAGRTLLMAACESFNVEGAMRLIAAGTEVNAAANDGTTALQIALHNRLELIAEELLRHRASVNCRTAAGGSPLLEACAAPYFRIARQLVDRGADVTARSASGHDALVNLVTAIRGPLEGEAMEVFRLLMEKGALSLGAVPPKCVSPLFAVIAVRAADLAARLIDGGADVNWRGPDGETPLMAACKKIGDGGVLVKRLLLRGADSTAIDRLNVTALQHACGNWDSTDAAHALLDWGADASVTSTAMARIVATAASTRDLLSAPSAKSLLALASPSTRLNAAAAAAAAASSSSAAATDGLIAVPVDDSSSASASPGTPVRGGRHSDSGYNFNLGGGTPSTPNGSGAHAGAAAAGVAAGTALRDRGGSAAFITSPGGGASSSSTPIITGSPLMSTIWTGSSDVTRAPKSGLALRLIHLGALVDIVDDRGRTPLGLACYAGMWDVASVILNRRINASNAANAAAAAAAAAAGGSGDNGTTPDRRNRINAAAAAAATPEKGSAVDVNRGGRVTGLLVEARPPLLSASAHGHLPTVRALLAAGADVNLAEDSAEGRTALVLACANKRWDVANALIACGADVNVGRGGGDARAPLLSAAEGGDVTTVEALLTAGADPKVTDDEGDGKGGRVPMDYAKSGGHGDVVDALLAHAYGLRKAAAAAAAAGSPAAATPTK